LTNLVTMETLSVTDIPGDYEHCGAVCTGGRTYVVYTAYDDRQKAIFLLIIGEDVPKDKIQLTDWGKFDFPSICVHQSKVVVSWENFSQTNSQIEYVIRW
jgi:hypothetical protein